MRGIGWRHSSTSSSDNTRMLFNKNGPQKQAVFVCTSKPFRLNPADSHMVRFGQRRIWYYGVFFCFFMKKDYI